MNFPDLSVHLEDTPQDLATRIADDFVTFFKRNKEEKKISIAVSGGNTPILLFDKLAREYYKSLIDWTKIHIFQVDERWVPYDQQDNNFNSLRTHLQKACPITTSHFLICHLNTDCCLSLVIDIP